MSNRKSVLLKKNRPPNFAGEKCSFTEAEADRLVANGDAWPLDEDGNPIVPASVQATETRASELGLAKSQADSRGSRSGGDDDRLRFNPFFVDGLDEKVIGSLQVAGINDPNHVREYVANGYKLSDIKGVDAGQESLLLGMYCEGIDPPEASAKSQSGKSAKVDASGKTSAQANPTNAREADARVVQAKAGEAKPGERPGESKAKSDESKPVAGESKAKSDDKSK